ncbi:MAG: DUF6538 domain-containing protein [Pseudomonadota bacterium]
MRSVRGWNHVYRRSNGTLYYVRRVPQDLDALINDRQFKHSLRHRDDRLPAFKAAYDRVHREVETYISQMRQGAAAPTARKEFELAVARAQRLGFEFRPMSELADDRTSIDELIERLGVIEGRIGHLSDPVADAVLGAVATPSYSLEDTVRTYADLNKTELLGRNEDQQKRWRNPLELAIRNFEELVGQRCLDTITREYALSFREWWIDRITTGSASTNAANKSLIALRKVVPAP